MDTDLRLYRKTRLAIERIKICGPVVAKTHEYILTHLDFLVFSTRTLNTGFC